MNYLQLNRFVIRLMKCGLFNIVTKCYEISVYKCKKSNDYICNSIIFYNGFRAD